MWEVAEEKRVALFRRYDIVKYWIDSGQFRIDDEVLLHDQFHLADPSYSCLAADWRTCWRPDPIK